MNGQPIATRTFNPSDYLTTLRPFSLSHFLCTSVDNGPIVHFQNAAVIRHTQDLIEDAVILQGLHRAANIFLVLSSATRSAANGSTLIITPWWRSCVAVSSRVSVVGPSGAEDSQRFTDLPSMLLTRNRRDHPPFSPVGSAAIVTEAIEFQSIVASKRLPNEFIVKPSL